MATRRPFWKWPHWKSIGFCLWPPSTCIWSLKLKFQSKLELCSGNHVVYRQTDGQTDGRTDKVNPVYPLSNFVSIMTKLQVKFILCNFAAILFEGETSGRLTHWGRVTHISVIKLTIIGSVNGLSPERRQAIIWTNGGILSIGPLGTNFNEILIKIHTFSFNKMPLKTSSAKRRAAILSRPQCVNSQKA